MKRTDLLHVKPGKTTIGNEWVWDGPSGKCVQGVGEEGGSTDVADDDDVDDDDEIFYGDDNDYDDGDIIQADGEKLTQVRQNPARVGEDL